MNIYIRDEQFDDIEEIESLIQAAFLNSAHSSHTEQFIVNRLRDDDHLTLSLVAQEHDQILGHVAISPVSIDVNTNSLSDGSAWYGLGPVSVRPDHQAKGIGTALIIAALNRLKKMQAQGCVLLGDPEYYLRFGFKAYVGLTLKGVPAEYFQCISFVEHIPQGEVSYHSAFNATS